MLLRMAAIVRTTRLTAGSIETALAALRRPLEWYIKRVDVGCLQRRGMGKR